MSARVCRFAFIGTFGFTVSVSGFVSFLVLSFPILIHKRILRVEARANCFYSVYYVEYFCLLFVSSLEIFRLYLFYTIFTVLFIILFIYFAFLFSSLAHTIAFRVLFRNSLGDSAFYSFICIWMCCYYCCCCGCCCCFCVFFYIPGNLISSVLWW